MDELIALAEQGYCVVPGVFDASAIAQMRLSILGNVDIMSNTRPTQTARHLAGFHRFACFEAIHAAIATGPRLRHILDNVYRDSQMIALGLSDITINRSQQEHVGIDPDAGQTREELVTEEIAAEGVAAVGVTGELRLRHDLGGVADLHAVRDGERTGIAV